MLELKIINFILNQLRSTKLHVISQLDLNRHFYIWRVAEAKHHHLVFRSRQLSPQLKFIIPPHHYTHLTYLSLPPTQCPVQHF